MRLSHGTQLALKALHIWKIACGTNLSDYLYLYPSCSKTCSRRNSRLVFSPRSWYIFFVEQVD